MKPARRVGQTLTWDGEYPAILRDEEGYNIAQFWPSTLDWLDLFKDAGNTYHATGLTPSELAAQRDELLEALSSAIKTAEFENHPLRHWHEAARAAITNATKGEK
jgi:hypothetical protein